jgi:putative NIF3 family GTP cyclohydrolase 1 type 2
LTASLIPLAQEQNVDMIITHEGLFSTWNFCGEKNNRIDKLKQKVLEESEISVYRFHDHAHREPDYIHTGFFSALDLKIKKKFPRESLGVCRYELDEAITTRQLAERIKCSLGIDVVRVVGKSDYPVQTICLCLGSSNLQRVETLYDPGCDLFITGEVDEVNVAANVYDACFFGENKSMLILGHYGSEHAGMKLLAEKLNKTLIDTIFLDGGEVFYTI